MKYYFVLITGEPNGVQNGGTESPPDDWDNMDDEQSAAETAPPTACTDNGTGPAESQTPKSRDIINDADTGDR